MTDTCAARLIIPFLVAAVVLTAQGACRSGSQEAVATGNAGSLPARYEGYVDQADCDTISGWAWDQNQPNTPVRIEVKSDDQLVAVITADTLRGNLIGAGKGNGRHAYQYVIRPSLKDGKRHLLHLKIAGSGFELGNSPKEIDCMFQGASKN